MADKKRGGKLKWLIILLIIGAVIAGVVWYFKRDGSETTQFQTAVVDRGEVTQTVTATGTLNPVVNVTVGSQVSGRVNSLYVDFNSQVTNGQVIAEIDPANYQAALQQATADLANAQANLELQQVQAQRSSELFTNKLVSGSDYDIALASLHQAEATVQIKEASVNNAKVNLNYCRIISPVDGVVISRAVELGQTVASSFNTPTLFQIANDLTKMQIDANVAEADVGGIEEKQDVDFTVDAYPYRTFRGVVTQVRNSPTTLNNVVTYDAVIGVNNADYKLKPGMTANVSIVIADRKDVLKIPNAALRFRLAETNLLETAASPTNTPATNQVATAGSGQGQGRHGNRTHNERQNLHTIYIQISDATETKPRLRAVQVKTGITDGIVTEVLDGLKEGDRIVTGIAYANSAATATGSNPFGGGGRRF
jgi:HlyD family secretion protein